MVTASHAAIQVIDRSARLMELIASHREPATLKLLSAESGLHPSTTFRILASLIDVGFVARDNSGHYFIGRKIRQLGESVAHTQDIRDVAREVMESLRDEINETINLTVREGDEVIYIERVLPNRMMRVEQVIGSRAPLHATAVGKLMLGKLGSSFIRGYCKRNGLRAYTKHTITTMKALTAEAHASVENAYAFDNEEAEIGVGCIGALIYDHQGQVVAGLSVSAPIERRQQAWIKLLQHAAEKISSRL